ncbi:MAG: hypothetical protein K8I27_14045 [Planctomycetes bacterium]|nr:hypothetical protein [Planctomycetota bacterium]
MKTKTTFSILALLAMVLAAGVSAEAREYRPNATTVHKLTDSAEIVIVARLDRVENIDLTEVGLDAARYKRLDDGLIQDGEDYIRREGVLSVNSVIKGDASLTGTEVRFVSIRQLKLPAYDSDLRGGEAVYFLSKRADGRYIVISDERGTVSAAESAGDLNKTTSFLKEHLATGSTSATGITRMLNAIALDASRLSVDCAIELSWHHESYAPAMTGEQRQRILDLCKLSHPGSEERNQLLTAAGRHPAEGALEGLLEVMLGDPSWSTTSLASMSLEYVNRGLAITRLLEEYELAGENGEAKIVIVRSLGLIRPKADYDGPAVRNDTLQLVNELLVATTDKDLLREALIASRDLRSGTSHLANLKALVDNRATNGLTNAEVNGAIIAICAAREAGDFDSEPIEKAYLKSLADSDPLLKQVVESAGKFPFSTLIQGADGKGH